MDRPFVASRSMDAIAATFDADGLERKETDRAFLAVALD
jgi:hypothetical protein